VARAGGLPFELTAKAGRDHVGNAVGLRIALGNLYLLNIGWQDRSHSQAPRWGSATSLAGSVGWRGADL